MFDIFLFLKSPGAEIISLGPFLIRWYGFLIAISLLIGINLSSKLAQERGLPKGLINDLIPFLVLASIIGARIYYVAFEWKNYSGINFWNQINFLGLNLSIPRAIEIWGGGIAIHGALIAGTISVIIFSQLKKQNFLNILDVLIPSVVLGQAIGRWGNFFNNEAFGIPTSMPWKLFIPLNNRPIVFINDSYFHPTFLYESIWNILIFIIIIFLFKIEKKKRSVLPYGSVSCIYLIMYSFGRFWIEGLRIDPLCVNSIPPFCEGGLRVAQFISILLMCLGVLGLSFINKKRKQRKMHQKI